MATIEIIDKPTPVQITQFFGLNSAEKSETQLKLGEASEMYNLRITEGYKMEQVDGYKNILPDTVIHKHFSIIEPVKVNNVDMLMHIMMKKNYIK